MMGWPKSLRWRLALGLLGGLMVLSLLVFTAAAIVVREELDEVYDSAMEQTAGRILALVVAEMGVPEQMLAPKVARTQPQEDYLHYVVRGPKGRIVRHSDGTDLALFADGPVAGFRKAQDYRIYSPGPMTGGYTVELAEPLSYRREATNEATRALFFPIFLLIPFGLSGLVLFVRRAMRPIDRLRDEVTARNGADLSPVSEAGLPQELAGIAAEVNNLLARLTATLEAERAFTTNSAHELRTPIAASLAQTQRLIAEAPPGPLADRARTIEGQLQRLARLSEKLLQLARVEGGGVLVAQKQDVTPFVAAVIEDFRRSGLGDRLHLALPDSAALTRIDPDACAILLRNLIENAERHGSVLGKVEVTLMADGGLRVVNDGPVVAPDTLARLHRRFERGAGAGQGSGLGLAIADTIARNAGGQLRLFSPAQGRTAGFEAEFLPA